MYGKEAYVELTPNGTYLDRNLFQMDDNLFRVASFESGFKALYDAITPIDLFVGEMLKKLVSTLSYGSTEANNTNWQVKARKATRNYAF